MLVIYLIGRICIVTRGSSVWAVFLNARHVRRLKIREHRPLLNVLLSRVLRQSDADASTLTVGTIVDGPANAQVADNLGVWNLSGYDMTIGGTGTGTSARDLSTLADLAKIVAPVDSKARFQTAIVQQRDPRRLGLILARLKLPKSAEIVAVSADRVPRTFDPGGYTQPLAEYVKCVLPFANRTKPKLTLRPFGSSKTESYRFGGDDDLTLTMSNLCNCVEQPIRHKGDLVEEDREFRMYYQLFRTLPKRLPTPLVDPSGVPAGGLRIPECFRPALATFP